jgi:hypothetical protein
MSHISRMLVCCLLCFGLTGCAHFEKVDADPEEALLARVNAWYQARVEQDFLRGYELIWSGFKEVVSQKDFLKRPKMGEISEFAVEKVDIVDAHTAKTTVMVDFTAMGYKFTGHPDRQTWVLEDGQWYIKLEPVISTPFGPVPIKKSK